MKGFRFSRLLFTSLIGLVYVNVNAVEFDIVPVAQIPEVLTESLVADFDQDGDQDVLFVSNGLRTRLLLNEGMGQFTTVEQTFEAAAFLTPRTAITADFNGDGLSDVAVADISSPDDNTNLLLLLGEQTSEGYSFNLLESALAQTDNGLIRTMVVFDYLGDDIPDIAVWRSGFDGLQILINDGQAGFSRGPTVELPADFGLTLFGCVTPDLLVADYNADGRDEIAIAGCEEQLFTAGENEDGSLFLVQTSSESDTIISAIPLVTGPEQLPSLLVNDRSTFSIATSGSGGLSISEETFGCSCLITDNTVADFNGDGEADMAAVIFSNFSSLKPYIAIFLSDPNLGFSLTLSSLTPIELGARDVFGLELSATDLNSDGLVDLILVDKGANTILPDQADLRLLINRGTAPPVRGTWFDSTQPGDGVFITGGDQLVLTFVGYLNEGQQGWLVSQPFTAPLVNGEPIILELFIGTTGNLSEAGNPTDSLQPWGTATLGREAGQLTLTLNGVNGTTERTLTQISR